MSGVGVRGHFGQIAWVTAALLIALPAAAQVPAPAAIQSLLAQGPNSPLGDDLTDFTSVRRFYVSRNNQPAWTGPGEQAQAQLAYDALAHSAQDGLDAARYHTDDIAALAKSRTADANVEYEILLSAELLRYENDVRLGQIAPATVDRDVQFPPQAFDSVAETGAALAQGKFAEFLASLPPPHPEYANLKRALASYRARP